MTEGPQKDSIYEKNGQLYARRQGKDYLLFIYTPLQQAMDDRHPVALGAEWSVYNQSFVKKYVPMPVVTSFPTDMDFNSQTRPAGDWYPYPQQTVNGWPLYYVVDLPGGQGAKTDQPALFEPATTSLPRIKPNPNPATTTAGGDDGVGDGWPPKYWGP